MAQGLPPWPTDTGSVLDYLDVRKREGAARTAYSSLLSSLRFLEEAGEVPAAERLSGQAALSNAVKELGLAAAEAAAASDHHAK